MIGPCPYNCNCKAESGYCGLTACMYQDSFDIINQLTTTTTTIIPKKQSLTLAKDAYDKIHSARETRSRSSDKVMVVLTDTEVQLIEELLETLI